MSDKRPDVVAGFSWATWRHDFLASVVVFLVALPLCMGIALASGVPPEEAARVGIVTGIIGGIVVGLLGGAPLQVSGPAAGLSVLVLQLIQAYGWEKLWIIVVLAGLFQFVAGLARIGQWFRAVSPAVIHGMLAGIGVLILASQFHVMVDDSPKGNGLQNLLSIPQAIAKGLWGGDASHYWAARVGVLTILVLGFWHLVPRRVRIIPAPLVAIILATVLVAATALPVQKVQLSGDFFGSFTLPSLAGLNSWSLWQSLILAGLSIAVIASAETLLAATAIDKMHTGPRTRYDRELTAQGVGNTLSGLAGGLPMTGVIVRSAANVQAGARSRLSAVLHGIWLLVFVGLFAGLLRYVPTSALAALLVYTGYKLVNHKAAMELWKVSRSEAVIYAATVFTIVSFDLLTGVLTGVILSAVKLLWTFSHLKVHVEDDPISRRTLIRLDGAATFLRLPALAAALEEVAADRELHIDFEHLAYIDHACLDLLITWEQQHHATGGRLVIDWHGLTARFRGMGNNVREREPPRPEMAPREKEGAVRG